MIDLTDPPGSGPSLAYDVRLSMELAYAHRDSRLSDFCRVHSSSGVGSALGNILSRYDDDATRSLIAEALSSLASSSTSAYSRTVIMELVLTASGRKMVQEKLPVLIHPYLKLTKELFVAVHSESLTTLAHTRSAQDMAAALDIILLLYDDARAREAITHALVALSTVDMDYAHAIIDQLAVSDKAIFEGIVLAKPPDQSHEAVSRAKEDFWTKIVDNLIDRLNAAIAGSGRLPRGRWLQLWRTGSIATSDSLARYLHRVGLDFNPFGPESAELDPRLPEYAALDQVDLVRGRKRVIMLGGPGSGLTATALLLAHQCDDPPESPVEIGAFPVYYPVFQLSDDRSRMSVCFLRSMSHVIARMLLRFVAVRPYGWLELPGEQRDRLSAFLLTSFGSKDSLLGELRRVARDPEYGRLANSVENARIGFIHTDDLDELDWLDLIAGSIPSGFDSIYILLDARDSTASNEAAGNWKTWLDLSVLLAANNVYLKIFAPTAARSLIGNEVGLESVTLTWDADKLGQTLRDRFGRAGGDSLAALCGPDAPRDADELFVQAALKSKAPPRQLIRLGNRLLVEHSAAAPDRPISGDEIDRILGSQPEQSAKTAGHTEPLRAGM